MVKKNYDVHAFHAGMVAIGEDEETIITDGYVKQDVGTALSPLKEYRGSGGAPGLEENTLNGTVERNSFVDGSIQIPSIDEVPPFRSSDDGLGPGGNNSDQKGNRKVTGMMKSLQYHKIVKGSAVEQLTTALNSALGWMVEHIRLFRGDVVKFAGDALIVMWKKEKNGSGKSSSSYLWRCVTCALNMRNHRILLTQMNLDLHVGFDSG